MLFRVRQQECGPGSFQVDVCVARKATQACYEGDMGVGGQRRVPETEGDNPAAAQWKSVRPFYGQHRAMLEGASSPRSATRRAARVQARATDWPRGQPRESHAANGQVPLILVGRKPRDEIESGLFLAGWTVAKINVTFFAFEIVMGDGGVPLGHPENPCGIGLLDGPDPPAG